MEDRKLQKKKLIRNTILVLVLTGGFGGLEYTIHGKLNESHFYEGKKILDSIYNSKRDSLEKAYRMQLDSLNKKYHARFMYDN